MNPPSFYQSIEFYATKLLHFILLLFIPMMIMPLTSLVSIVTSCHVVVM